MVFLEQSRLWLQGVPMAYLVSRVEIFADCDPHFRVK
jgi:hypothetical protein